MTGLLKRKLIVVLFLVIAIVLATVAGGNVTVKQGHIQADSATLGSTTDFVEIGIDIDSDTTWDGVGLNEHGYQLVLKGRTPGIKQEICRYSDTSFAFTLLHVLARNDNGVAEMGKIGCYGGCGEQAGALPYPMYIYIGAQESTTWDNAFMRIDAMNRLGLGLADNCRPNYPLEVGTSVGDVSVYSANKISADGYLAKTSVFDKSKDVWDYIKDANYYLSDGQIDPRKFYGYVSYTITDYSRPVIVSPNTGADDLPAYSYPHEKFEEAISLDAEVSLLRQAVYELKQQNESLQIQLNELRAMVEGE
jgi:hypothetical protein